MDLNAHNSDRPESDPSTASPAATVVVSVTGIALSGLLFHLAATTGPTPIRAALLITSLAVLFTCLGYTTAIASSLTHLTGYVTSHLRAQPHTRRHHRQP